MTLDIDWEQVNADAGLDQPDAVGSKVESRTKLLLALKVYTDHDPEDALEAGLEAGVLQPNYIEREELDGDGGFTTAGRQLRGYVYIGPGAGDSE